MFSSERPPAQQCTPAVRLGSATHLGDRELIIEGRVVRVQFQVDVLELLAATTARCRVDGDRWGATHGGQQGITPKRRAAVPKVGQTGGGGPPRVGQGTCRPGPHVALDSGGHQRCPSLSWKPQPWPPQLHSTAEPGASEAGLQGCWAAASSPLVPGLSYTVARLKGHGHARGQPQPADPLTFHLLGLAAQANVTSGN